MPPTTEERRQRARLQDHLYGTAFSFLQVTCHYVTKRKVISAENLTRAHPSMTLATLGCSSYEDLIQAITPIIPRLSGSGAPVYSLSPQPNGQGMVLEVTAEPALAMRKLVSHLEKDFIQRNNLSCGSALTRFPLACLGVPSIPQLRTTINPQLVPHGYQLTGSSANNLSLTPIASLEASPPKDAPPVPSASVAPTPPSIELFFGFSSDLKIMTGPQAIEWDPPTLESTSNDSELDELLLQLPNEFSALVKRLMSSSGKPLLEIKVDAGRAPVLLFAGETEQTLDHQPLTVSTILERLAENAGVQEENHEGLFTSDNRMGLAHTLHRISCLRSRRREIIGLTFRVGRHVPRAMDLILDLVQKVAVEGTNLLLLGGPGTGKTTLLRGVIQALSLLFQQRVIVVDTSNEIAGDGVVPHASIGKARRMQVPDRELQHDVLIEAVQNHNPQIVVVDEIGTPLEARAARTIAQRGVGMVGTAHGRDLFSLLNNPELDFLVGGHESILLGDEEMRARAKKTGHKQKLIFQRKMTPVFGQVVEILDWNHYKIYPHTADAIDALLGVKPACTIEYRSRSEEGFRVRYEQYPSETTPSFDCNAFE